MERTVYTVYWENKRDDIRKEHGTYDTENQAKEGIQAWWDLQNDEYTDVHYHRTNTGALEVTYNGDDNYVYRIEKRETDAPKAKTSYKLKSQGQREADRKKYDLRDDQYLFDDLAEPYRDRLMVAMNDIQKARNNIYTENGQLIKSLDD